MIEATSSSREQTHADEIAHAPAVELPVGSVIAERYRLDEVIGRGGMATVYRGHDERLGRDVAVKLCRPSPELPASPLQEERVSSSLVHNNIVSIFDAGEIPDGGPAAGSTFIVMEFVHGTTAHAIAPVPWRQAVDIVSQAADGLAAAHRCGIVHCDVKPGNLLIDHAGRVKVADFGVAVEEHSEVGDYVHGSPAYISPERLSGERPDARVDVYGLGGVLEFLLTGESPSEDGLPQLAASGLAPAALAAVIAQARSRDPNRRYADAGEMRVALDQVTAAAGAATERVDVLAGEQPTRALEVERRQPVQSESAGPGIERDTRAVVPPSGRARAVRSARTARSASVPGRPQPAPSHTRVATIVGIIAIGLVVLLFGGRILGGVVSDGTGGAPAAAAVAVPDVRGQTFAAAISQLAEHGIVVDRVEIVYAPGTLNLVVDQQPAPGDEVGDDGVTLIVRTSK